MARQHHGRLVLFPSYQAWGAPAFDDHERAWHHVVRNFLVYARDWEDMVSVWGPEAVGNYHLVADDLVRNYGM